MKIELHFQNLKESLTMIEECVERGLTERQRTLGFHTSAACADLLEILFHRLNLIDPSLVIKHEWLKSPRSLREKFPFDFTHKQEIFLLIVKIEERRNALCYGKPQQETVLQEVVQDFQTVQKLFKEAGINEL